jgi:tetratricopeptide (TPR) repeat protein
MEEIQPAAGVGGTSDIYERIELLKRIYEQREFDARAASVQPAAAEAPPALEELPLPMPVQERPTPKNMSEIGSQFAAAATAAPTSNAQRAVSAPVDLFELGNSLYQTGNLLTALDAYVQVDRNTITAAEAVWLDFMIASCHRRMGNWDDASRLYREVANQNDAPYLTKPAQSWLKQVELASKSKTEYSDIENQINLLLEKGQTNVTK